MQFEATTLQISLYRLCRLKLWNKKKRLHSFLEVGKEVRLTKLIDGKRLGFLAPRSTVEPTAYEIVRATALGRAEVYFPHLLGYIPGGYRLFPILRHIKHDVFYAG